MPGPKITVAAVLAARPDYEEARELLFAWSEEACRRGAQYVCFPEYYFDRAPDERGNPVRGFTLDGPLIEETRRLAGRLSVSIVVGLTERELSRRHGVFDYYNSAVLIGPQGVRGVQRKVFLWVDPEWNEARRKPENRGGDDYPYPPLVDERRRYLPGWNFYTFPLGRLERAAAVICADALMPPTWSHLIPQSPQLVFNLNCRAHLLSRWGPDLAHLSRTYRLPVAASNNWPGGEAAVFDSDGSCLAKVEGEPGIAVGEVTLAGSQPAHKPVEIRHWDGDPDSQLGRPERW